MRRIRAALCRLYGRPCWQVKKGYASFLTLEFGEPHLHVHERVREGFAPRLIVVHGDWHLWIHSCDWAVFEGARRIGHSEGTDRNIERAARSLDGRKLVGAEVVPRGMRTVFEFESGVRLETWPYDRTGEQWLLYESGRNVLTVRADRKYSYGKGNRTPGRKRWLPIRD